MHEIFIQLLRYARGVWQYRWWMLGIAWVFCLAGWTIVARMPDQYVATSRVYVDTDSVLLPLLKGLAIETGNTERKVLLMTRTLLSQPNLEQVLRMTDLDLQIQSEQDKEDLISKLRQGISLKGEQRENLYTISYAGESPEVAREVVKSLLTIFMEGNLGEVRKDQDSATSFLEQQIAEYARRMQETEETLTRFKQQNLGYLPNETGGYYARIRELKDQHSQAELDLRVAEDRVKLLRAQLAGNEPVFDLGPTEAQLSVDTQDIDRRIQALEVRLDDLLLKYTEEHPDVISMRKVVADLQRQKERQIAEAKREMKNNPQTLESSESPYIQQLRIALSQAEADLAAKRVILEEYNKRLEELKAGIEKVLSVEAEQAQMARDYQVLKSNHATLVARLEAAKLGRRADTSSDTVQFKVIDPPRVPSTPSGPNRVLFSTGVLVVGLGIGFAVAFLMSQLRPTFSERKILNEVLGLPVLGSVNMVWTADQLRARKVRNASFALSLTALIAGYTGVMVLHQFNLEPLARMTQSLDQN